MRLDEPEIRVLGCLVEKQRTTPDAYPLTLPSLVRACNQATNREPVVDYDETTVRAAVSDLSRRRLARTASGPGSRAPKYRHLAEEGLGVDADELAVLTVLMLRGPQTLGELRQRCDRLHAFGSLDEVAATLERLAQRSLAERQPRRPGHKEERYAHLLADPDAGAAGPPSAVAADGEGEERAAATGEDADVLAGLETRVRVLEQAVAELRRELGL